MLKNILEVLQHNINFEKADVNQIEMKKNHIKKIIESVQMENLQTIQ